MVVSTCLIFLLLIYFNNLIDQWLNKSTIQQSNNLTIKHFNNSTIQQLRNSTNSTNQQISTWTRTLNTGTTTTSLFSSTRTSFFLRTAQMGVHHRLLLRMDRYLVSLQDSCLVYTCSQGPLAQETAKTSIRLFSNSFHTMIISVYI